jgi:HKD family nuclease
MFLMTAKIQILSNTNYAIAEVIKSELLESTKVNIAVAFLKKTGIDHISKALDYALTKNNATVEIIAGLDFKTTDYKALLTLEEIKSKNNRFAYYCFGDKRDNFNDLVFHPKIYLFNNDTPSHKKYTSIVGSSNLTGGGLSSNFEVNAVFREEKPVYYSQLEAIYNEIKFTDSVFIPTKDYLEKYAIVKERIDRFGEKAESSLKGDINELKKEEENLPGAFPTMKKIIIEIIKEKQKEGLKVVPLKTIYEESEKIVKEKQIPFKMDTFRNSIRGELNKHEQGSKHPDNMSLFIRSSIGHYSLTDKGVIYNGR